MALKEDILIVGGIGIGVVAVVWLISDYLKSPVKSVGESLGRAYDAVAKVAKEAVTPIDENNLANRHIFYGEGGEEYLAQQQYWDSGQVGPYTGLEI